MGNRRQGMSSGSLPSEEKGRSFPGVSRRVVVEVRRLDGELETSGREPSS